MADQSNWTYVDTEGKYQSCKLDGGVWSVSETIVSDAVNFYGKGNCLFYRVGAGQFAKPSDAKTFAEDALDVYPGYAYMLSRALWGDNLTVCEYKETSAINTSSNKDAIRSFITNHVR